MKMQVKREQSIFNNVMRGIFLIISFVFMFQASASNPCIELDKTGVTRAVPGDTIDYHFNVKNCGDITLASGAYVYDLMFSPNAIWSGDLKPGDDASFTMPYTVTTDDCGELVNNAWADGYPVNGDPKVTDTSSWTVYVVCDGGTGTPGYWKNHADAWPVELITIGAALYTKTEAIEILDMPEKGNKLYTVFRALVAATLNILNGADSSCIEDTVTAADSWMSTNGPLDGDKVAGSSDEWGIGEPLYWMLDDYNNGLLCAPARD